MLKRMVDSNYSIDYRHKPKSGGVEDPKVSNNGRQERVKTGEGSLG
jgi:hypothetical protein